MEKVIRWNFRFIREMKRIRNGDYMCYNDMIVFVLFFWVISIREFIENIEVVYVVYVRGIGIFC